MFFVAAAAAASRRALAAARATRASVFPKHLLVATSSLPLDVVACEHSAKVFTGANVRHLFVAGFYDNVDSFKARLRDLLASLEDLPAGLPRGHAIAAKAESVKSAARSMLEYLGDDSAAAGFVNLHDRVSALEAETDVLKAEKARLRVRAAGDALKELSLACICRVQPELLKQAGVYSIEGVERLQGRPARIAAHVRLPGGRVGDEAYAAAVAAARKAVCAGIASYGETIATEAATKTASGSTSTEVDAAVQDAITRRLLTVRRRGGELPSADALASLMAVDVASVQDEYAGLFSQAELAAVRRGHSAAKAVGDTTAHPPYAALAAADLEADALRVFGGTPQLADVQALVRAFRRAYAAACGTAAGKGAAGSAGARASSNSEAELTSRCAGGSDADVA